MSKKQSPTSFIKVSEVGILIGKRIVLSVSYTGRVMLDSKKPVSSMLEQLIDMTDSIISWENKEEAEVDIAMAVAILNAIEIEDKRP